MEYLITYGVAIFVILIVLAILVPYLLDTLKTPSSCLAETGFNCNEPKPTVSAAAGTNSIFLSVRFSNQQRTNVQIVKVMCTNAPIAQVNPDMGGVLSDVGVPAGVSDTIVAGSFIDMPRVPCEKVEGGVDKPIQLAKGSDFKGTLVVWYHVVPEIEGAPLRYTTASVSGPVIEQ